MRGPKAPLSGQLRYYSFISTRERGVRAGASGLQRFPCFAIWDSSTLFKENPHGSLDGPEEREAGKEI